MGKFNMDKWDWNDDEYRVETDALTDATIAALDFGEMGSKEYPPCTWTNSFGTPDYTPISQTKMFESNAATVYFVKYKPNTTLGVGYGKLFVLEHYKKKGEHVFPRMREMWKTLHEFNKPGGKKRKQLGEWYGLGAGEGNCSVGPDGEIRTAFGMPRASDAIYLSYQVGELYDNWKHFPNVKSYDKVQKLKGALSDVYAMQMNAEQYQREIDDTRERIKEYQEHIADTEKRMTEMYEQAAEAMNLLEENGVEVDLNKPLDMSSETFNKAIFLTPSMYTIKCDPGDLVIARNTIGKLISLNSPGDTIC